MENQGEREHPNSPHCLDKPQKIVGSFRVQLGACDKHEFRQTDTQTDTQTHRHTDL